MEILFHLCELAHPGQRMIDLNDLDRLDPERLKRGSQIKRLKFFCCFNFMFLDLLI